MHYGNGHVNINFIHDYYNHCTHDHEFYNLASILLLIRLYRYYNYCGHKTTEHNGHTLDIISYASYYKARLSSVTTYTASCSY